MKIPSEHLIDLFTYDAGNIIPDQVIAEYLINPNVSDSDCCRVSKIQLINNPITSGRPFYAIWFIKKLTAGQRGNILAGFTTKKEALDFAQFVRLSFIETENH